jgi:peptidoglycan/LPS O-acetylase OafA/YrhL
MFISFFTGAVLPKLRVESIKEVFQNGWLGVDVFFVISGFIIPCSLLGKGYNLEGFWATWEKNYSN